MAQPTAFEQYFLELVNAARANPAAEAARLGIDLNAGLAAGTISATAKQPLAFNPLLIDAARGHSDWMLATDTFSHTGANGSSPGDRMGAAGYAFTGSWTWGENITITWGGGITLSATLVRTLEDGLFKSAGHRVNILNDSFQEVGIGIGTGDYQGSSAIDATQDFAKSGSGAFLTGVAFNDVNGDNFYEPGEGLGGISVQIRSSNGQTWQTTTWDAGGYQIRVAAGEYDVTFSGGGLAAPVTKHASVGALNVKLDLNTHAGAGTPPPLPPPPPSPAPSPGMALAGGEGSQALVGGTGADTITGGAWNDGLTGGTGADRFVFQPGDGKDTIHDFQTGADQLVLQGVAATQVSMSATTIGGKTGLLVSYDAQGDTVFLEGVGGLGAGDINFAAAPAGVTYIGTGWADGLTGGSGNDVISGGGGNDRLSGRAGYDRLIGGYGADALTGGTGADTFVYRSLLEGSDIITDFNQLAGDRIDLSAIFAAGPHTQAALVGGGYVRLVQAASGVQVLADANGGGDGFRTLATLSGASLASLQGDIIFA